MSDAVSLDSLVNRVKVGYVGVVDKYYCDANTGIKIYRPTDITEYGFDDSDVRYITREFYNKNKKSQVHKGDVVISRCGKDGIPVIYKSDEPAQILNAVIIEPDNKKMSSEEIQLYLRSPYAQKQILNCTSGSVQGVINTEMIAALQVDTSIDYSKAANLINTFEDKIFNNNQICANLEAMAKLLYDYWFVQFDFPDENGKPYKSSGGKMVWNDKLKCEIPAGWEVKPLGEYISVIRGISYKPTDELKQSTANSISLLKSNNIQNGTINFDQPVFLPPHLADSSQWLTEGSVFITMSSGSKAHMGKTAIVYKDLPYVFGAFCAKIVIDDSVRGYLSTYFRSEWFRAYIENVTAGTSINNIGNDQLTNILLPFPESDIQKRFEDYLKPMFIRQGELGTETQQLASLRDFLLPMLMDGQVKVGA